jgi:hypothetical protein
MYKAMEEREEKGENNQSKEASKGAFYIFKFRAWG